MTDKTFWRIVVAALVLSALGGVSALVIAIVQAGSQVLSSVVLIILQVLLAIVAIAVSFALTWWLVGTAVASISKRFAAFEEHYKEQFRRLKAKRPAWIATLLFVTEAVMILVDKSFDGHERETLIASFSLLIGFWVANQLMTCEQRWKQLLGGGLWFIVLLFLPVLIAVHRHLTFSQFFAFLWSLDADVKVFFSVAFLALITLPTLALRSGAEAG